jgi:hypothetical protein
MLKQLAIASCFVLFLFAPRAQPAFPPAQAPAYTNDGNLVIPIDYREWTFLTSGIDMSYVAPTAPPAHSVFDNVFVNSASYRSFVETGTWPDKTTFILEIRAAEAPISINKRGHTQSSTVHALEIHVKDNGKWSFFDASDGGPEAKRIPPPATCYTCHESHAAVDTTFVQFYPTLLPIAQQKKTLSAAYLQETSIPSTSSAVPAAK